MSRTLATVQMSSKGQVIIPESVRSRLGLKDGARFVVLGHGDTVMLKVIAPPSDEEFEEALGRLRKGARTAGRSRKDIPHVIADVQGRK